MLRRWQSRGPLLPFFFRSDTTVVYFIAKVIVSVSVYYLGSYYHLLLILGRCTKGEEWHMGLQGAYMLNYLLFLMRNDYLELDRVS